MKAKSAETEKFRCGRCGILLACIDGSRLTVKRGRMSVTIDSGAYRASVTCYRTGCHEVNVLHLPRPPDGPVQLALRF